MPDPEILNVVNPVKLSRPVNVISVQTQFQSCFGNVVDSLKVEGKDLPRLSLCQTL